MSSRALTGITLIVGPIMMIAFFLAGPMGAADPSDLQALSSSLGNNVLWSEISLSLAILGLLLRTVGINGIKNMMSGGSGYHLADLGFIFILIGAAGELIEISLLIGIANNAASHGIVEALHAVSGAIGPTAVSCAFLGFATIGLAILIQKNFHMLIALGAIVIGIIGTILPVANYESDLMIIPYLGLSLLLVTLGILVLRAKD
ncbi:MAG: hypothetical protein VX966_01320 [Chloroflexota bacterium]|nr:hypothetical protein [Chloroflexota bacterium]